MNPTNSSRARKIHNAPAAHRSHLRQLIHVVKATIGGRTQCLHFTSYLRGHSCLPSGSWSVVLAIAGGNLLARGSTDHRRSLDTAARVRGQRPSSKDSCTESGKTPAGRYGPPALRPPAGRLDLADCTARKAKLANAYMYAVARGLRHTVSSHADRRAADQRQFPHRPRNHRGTSPSRRARSQDVGPGSPLRSRPRPLAVTAAW